tara:strand:- start:5777 stop:7630 length:1854 start_codon:yes stop_codon:yes gene_type:complete
MQLLYLLISILFLSGFYYVGQLFLTYFKFDKNIKKISDPIYQNSVVGIAVFIFIIYPIFFLGFFRYQFFTVISSIITVLGIYNFYNNYFFLKKIIFKKILTIDIISINHFYFLFIILYFLLSISPITSGDSVAYHLSSAKYILLNGKFPSFHFDSSNSLVGAGELLNTFALSINAYNFNSLINIVAIVSILGILKKFCEKFNADDYLKQFIYLSILSCPVLVFLVSSVKSQLFSISLIFLSYSLLLLSINYDKQKKFLVKNFYISILVCIVAVQTKISFSLSFFLIILSFLILIRKEKFFFKIFVIFILLSIIGLMPYPLWKQSVYSYPFYNFLINPFPLNIAGYDEVFISAKNYLNNKFPLSLLIPLSISDLTQFIGVGCFGIIFLIKYDFKNKKKLLLLLSIFLIIYSILGQKTPRFYLEIYFLSVLFFCIILEKIKKTYTFKIFNFLILIQSIFVLSILIVGNISLAPGILSENLNKKTLSKYANGYNLYNWTNSVLPKNSIFLTNHRSTFFSKNKTIFFEMAFHSKNLSNTEKIYLIDEIKKEKPKYILFYGYDKSYQFYSYNFFNCTNGLFKKKLKVGFNETRNIFNTNNEYYDAYIYHLDYSKFPDCVNFN